MLHRRGFLRAGVIALAACAALSVGACARGKRPPPGGGGPHDPYPFAEFRVRNKSKTKVTSAKAKGKVNDVVVQEHLVGQVLPGALQASTGGQYAAHQVDIGVCLEDGSVLGGSGSYAATKLINVVHVTVTAPNAASATVLFHDSTNATITLAADPNADCD